MTRSCESSDEKETPRSHDFRAQAAAEGLDEGPVDPFLPLQSKLKRTADRAFQERPVRSCATRSPT